MRAGVAPMQVRTWFGFGMAKEEDELAAEGQPTQPLYNRVVVDDSEEWATPGPDTWSAEERDDREQLAKEVFAMAEASPQETPDIGFYKVRMLAFLYSVLCLLVFCIQFVACLPVFCLCFLLPLKLPRMAECVSLPRLACVHCTPPELKRIGGCGARHLLVLVLPSPSPKIFYSVFVVDEIRIFANYILIFFFPLLPPGFPRNLLSTPSPCSPSV